MDLRRRVIIFSGTCLVAVVISACGAASKFPGTDISFRSSGLDNSASPMCDPYASDLEGLVRVSDKVVVATVASAEPDFQSTYGTPTPQNSDKLQVGEFLNRNIQLDVEQVISDQQMRPLVRTSVPGWTLSQDRVWYPFEINDNHWLEVGDRAVFPLIVPVGNISDLHSTLCTGVFLLKDGAVVPKEPEVKRLLEFGTEGPNQVSAYQMTEEQLITTLTALTQKQGTAPSR